jgi:hypothetical protein
VAVPIELVGAWRRSGLLLNGVRKVDHCDVIWLQTTEWFADIRLLIDPDAKVSGEGVPAFFYREFAFAGVGTWEPPLMTWDHRLDSSLTPSLDANPLTWRDGVAVETGSATVDGEPVEFIEEWLRMTGDDVICVATVDEHAARIEVGRFAIEIRDDRPTGAFVATRYEQRHGDWVVFGSVQA